MVIYRISKAASQHRLRDFYDELFGDRTVLEGQLTPGIRTIITREPVRWPKPPSEHMYTAMPS